MLLSKAGFEILSIDTDDIQAKELIEINALFRKPINSGGGFDEQNENNRKDMKDEISEHDIVTIWGAGTKAHKYIKLVKEIHISHIVDKEDSKSDLNISDLQVPIVEPNMDIINESTVIIIFVSMFNHEIIEDLKRMKYCGKIIYFHQGSVHKITL